MRTRSCDIDTCVLSSLTTTLLSKIAGLLLYNNIPAFVCMSLCTYVLTSLLYGAMNCSVILAFPGHIRFELSNKIYFDRP